MITERIMNRRLSIGPVQLDFPAVQAALSGYSDGPMRRMARRYGAPYALCEVMLDRFVMDVSRSGRGHSLLSIAEDDHPVGAQLMGADPEQFGPSATTLIDAGFDVIDINFGCPVKKVLGRCRGGFHLSQPDVATEIVRRVRDAVPHRIPVTIKMRRGIDDSAESRDRFFEILDGAFDAGVAAITVHGRTVQQRYVGASNWSFLKEVKQHVGERTILGSGDLFSAEACEAMMTQTGVDGVTIARGAIGNPWIFRQCRQLTTSDEPLVAPTIPEQRTALRQHLEFAQQTYDEKRCLSTMRKFAIKYSRLHPDHETLRVAFARAKTLEQWQRVLEDHYAVDGAGQFPQVDDTG